MQNFHFARRVASCAFVFSLMLIFNHVGSAQAITNFSQSRPYDPRATEPAGSTTVTTPEFVTIPVTVLTSDGRLLLNLVARDFSVYLGSTKAEVLSVETRTTPLHIGLLVDMSPSASTLAERIKAVVRQLIQNLQPDNKVTIASFDEKVRILARATNDRQALDRAVKDMKGVSGTSVYDALTTLLSEPEPFTAIVLITDGADTTSKKTTFTSSIAAVERTMTRVFSIYIDPESTPGNDQVTFRQGVSDRVPSAAMQRTIEQVLQENSASRIKIEKTRGRNYLNELLIASGGRAVQFRDVAAGKTGAVDSIPYELLNQYYIRVRVPADQREERSPVTVRVEKPNLVILAKGSVLFR